MRRSKMHRFSVGALLVGMVVLTSCAAPYAPAQRRAMFSRDPMIYGDPKVMETHPYLAQFRDILIPGELSEVADHTAIVETRGEKTGFVVYSGRITKTAVEVFFRGQLKKKGWTLVTAFSSSPSTVLLFNKKERWCVITMDGRGPTTDVRLGVALDLGLAPRLLGQGTYR